MNLNDQPENLRTRTPSQKPKEEEEIDFDISKTRIVALKTRLTYEYAKMDPTYVLCYLGFIISEMGFILSTIYINAWVSTFFP